MDVDDVERIAVLGAGNMGHGIAEVAALAEYDVQLRDISEELVQSGYDDIEWSLNKLAEKDHITDEEATAALERVTPVVDVAAAVGDADVVIEAVPERMDVKREVYEEVSNAAPERTIFATNTSSLSITDLAATTDRPEQFCGMHFFNPPVRMDLVEVVHGDETSEATVDMITTLAERLGKTPVQVYEDEPGFVVNRVLVPFLNEACWLVHEGEATIEAVDATTKYDMGLPMGAFELADTVGNDVTLHVLEYMAAELGSAYDPCPMLESAVEDERLGTKTDRGWYDYEAGGVDIDPDLGESWIETRLLAVMANEVGKLQEKAVADVDAVDTALKLGAGFPEGPARLADEAGLEELIEALTSAAASTEAERYAVSEGLREAAESGGFRDVGGATGPGATGPGAVERAVDLDLRTLALDQPRPGVLEVTIDRAQRMNAITEAVLEDLDAVLDVVPGDDSVGAILLTGAGNRAFSAGADVQSFAGEMDRGEAVRLSRAGQDTFGDLEACPVPVVAGIDGVALGGGMELAAAADLRVATERSTLGQPEHDLGILPGWGGTQRLARIVGEGRATEIVFTTERYDPATLADYGFLNDVVQPAEFPDAALDLAEDLANGPPIAQALTKEAMLAGRDGIDAGLEVEAQSFGHAIASADRTEGVSAFLDDETPEFTGEW